MIWDYNRAGRQGRGQHARYMQITGNARFHSSSFIPVTCWSRWARNTRVGPYTPTSDIYSVESVKQSPEPNIHLVWSVGKTPKLDIQSVGSGLTHFARSIECQRHGNDPTSWFRRVKKAYLTSRINRSIKIRLDWRTLLLLTIAKSWRFWTTYSKNLDCSVSSQTRSKGSIYTKSDRYI